MSEVLEKVRQSHDLPALGCVVFRGDSTLEEAVVGVRKAGDPTPATLDDKFHIGSLTKSMTATLAAMLVADGRLRWDSTTEQILGSAVPNIDPAYRAVTLRQWLGHRGGAPHDPPGELWSGLWARNGQPGGGGREWFVSGILQRPPAQKSGTFVYSNTGYMIAGLMLEKAAQRPWEGMLRERVFQPLGLKTAGFGCAASPGQVDQPWGHVKGKPVPPGPQADNPSGLGPAGIVHCSLRDLARYAAFHLREGKGKPNLLDPASFAILHRPPPGEAGDSYACGWMRVPRPWAGGEALTHNGCNTMNYAVIWLAPERDFGLVAATNEGRAEAGQALDEVASAMVAKHCPAAKPAAPAPITPVPGR